MTRKELERLVKAQAETIIQLQARIVELEAIVADLQAKLGMNSSNSSKPPSSDGYNKPTPPPSTRTPSGKKPGGQPGHKGSGFQIPERIDEIQKAAPETCWNCERNLTSEDGTVIGHRYVSDIPEISLRTVRVDRIRTQCPCCGAKNEGTFPNGVNSTFQYGVNLKAFVATLVNYGMVSIERTQEIISGALNTDICQGTIQSMLYDCANAVSDTVDEIRKAIIKAPVIHNDETGFRVSGKLHWLHSASTDKLTHITVHPKRGMSGMEHGGILPHFEGVSVHDCWPAYFKFGCMHALCNAHIIRELRGIYEITGQEWTQSLSKLLLDLKELTKWHQTRGAECLPFESILDYYEMYDRIIREGLALNPMSICNTKKKGRVFKGKALCLLERLADHRDKVLFCIRDFKVPWDNNQAERDIRIVKLKHKVSGGARTIDGALAFTQITSFMQTVRKHGLNVFFALQSALLGDSFSFDSHLLFGGTE
jgi:transposase